MLLLENIRSATKESHEALDTAMMPAIKSIHSAEAYVRLLIAFYGFFKPVYELIEAHLQTSLLPDYPTRRKPSAILENLAALHFHQPVTHLCEDLPLITNNAAAFGALYVMEGSTLGGLVIKKMIATQTGLQDGQISFFNAYGKETKERWNTFIIILNGIAKDGKEEASAIVAATETFALFRRWLDVTFF